MQHAARTSRLHRDHGDTVCSDVVQLPGDAGALPRHGQAQPFLPLGLQLVRALLQRDRPLAGDACAVAQPSGDAEHRGIDTAYWGLSIRTTAMSVAASVSIARSAPRGVPHAMLCQMPRPTTCRIDLFTVPTGTVTRALVRMATDRRHLRRAAPAFWKLLGTGDGRTFDARDADLRRWAVLTVWPSRQDADAFVDDPVVSGWGRLATEHWWGVLRPLRATGRWSGAQPFVAADAARPDGAIAVVTRARLRWRRAARFWRSVGAVNDDLDRADGLLLRLGIGEAPVGLQGTFSLWSSAAAMQTFAYRGAPHRHVVRRSTDERWYAEELFARFTVADSGGTIFGDDPLRS